MKNVTIEMAMQAIENARNDINGEYINELFNILTDLETIAEKEEDEFKAFKLRAAIHTGINTISYLQKRAERMRKYKKE